MINSLRVGGRMKILLVLNKTINLAGIQQRLDPNFYNVYIPLLSLGHEVYFYDTVSPKEKDLNKIIEQFKPELIFSCLTGNETIAPYEQLNVIEQETKKGNKTFNWFCDDTWRFDDFSKQICHKFTCCSTPEPTAIQKYKDFGYNNILLGLWHSNIDFYIPSATKESHIVFCGFPNEQRSLLLEKIKSLGKTVVARYGICYEDMLDLYGSFLFGINFSLNENGQEKKTQMKLRMMEVPAANSMLITEYTPGLEEIYVLDEEIIAFTNEEELMEKIEFYTRRVNLSKKIAYNGHMRFLAEHESKIRLTKLLEQIGKI